MSPEARERSFDDLARAFAENSISRRQAIKWAGYGVVGAALSSMGFADRAEALTRLQLRRCRSKGGTPLETGTCHCAVKCTSSDFSQFHCHNNKNCTCLRTVSGKGFCAQGIAFVDVGCPNQTKCSPSTRCVVFPGCKGSGKRGCTRAHATKVCPSGFGCVNGTCQATACVSPCET
jgi:hypothetical protein